MGRSAPASQAFTGIDPSWPPLALVEAGWSRLSVSERERVVRRLGLAVDRFDPPSTVNRAALRRFFSFLAQMEPIAIEVPMEGLDDAAPELVPVLERQLADEVFHALMFARLAVKMGGLERPVAQAERVLAMIRAPEDRRVRHVLLNLLAEEWFETLFRHAGTWGVADDVFRMALADEARHVSEGRLHAGDLSPKEFEPAVRDFELELFRLVQNPRILLPHLALAGADGFQALAEAYAETHERALGELGLRPTEAFQEMIETLRTLEEVDDEHREAFASELPGPAVRVEPESQWRRTALHLWDVPRNPVMHGWFDVPVDHIPSKHMTAVFAAAVGRVWHEYPRMNRFASGGTLYRPAGVNVGVRVVLGDQMEALSTIVITQAHRRSVSDIERILEVGVREMNELGRHLAGVSPDEEMESLREVLRDEELMGMVPPDIVAAPVTISNVGRAGLVAGVGAMPGALGQSVELIMGRVQQRPLWNGERYVPAGHVTIGASADHRVLDGTHAAVAIQRIEEGLSEQGVREILAREDTIPDDEDLADATLQRLNMNNQQVQLVMSCKLPFWLGWLCWLFKK